MIRVKSKNLRNLLKNLNKCFIVLALQNNMNTMQLFARKKKEFHRKIKLFLLNPIKMSPKSRPPGVRLVQHVSGDNPLLLIHNVLDVQSTLLGKRMLAALI